MKKQIIALAFAASSSLVMANEATVLLEDKNDKVSYGFGLMLGKRMAQDIPDLEIDAFAQGVRDAIAGKNQQMTDAEVSQLLAEFQREQQQKRLEEVQKTSSENKKKGEDFLAANKDKEGVVTLESGLQYKVITEGKGVQPGLTDRVKVHYTGTLIDGTVFDSSVERGQPAAFPVNGVISGWTEALQLMPSGSKWQLYIPSDLAYGPNGNRSIGPNETLLFEVELLEVVKP